MTGDLATAREALERSAERILPRILTQLDRDPTSPTYGCADRNWWHYKIRDFPSVILQQAGETVWLAAQSAEGAEAVALRELAAATCRFWNARATRYGAFEEYYPYERGYPPLAFSSLAVARLAKAGAVEVAAIRDGCAVAARQLVARFEAQAANQQVAGLAALEHLRRLDPALVSPSDLARVRDRTLGLQHGEGWFPEYDGPDVGYLSVVLDCLWDAYDASGDERYLDAGARAVVFTDTVVGWCGGSPGMLNSRNTDYLTPYGLLRWATDGSGAVAAAARRSFTTLFDGIEEPAHFMQATDDRYLAHYLGTSVMRAASWTAQPAGSDEPIGGDGPVDGWLPGAGYWHRSSGATSVVVAAKKGGIVRVRVGERELADHGWTVRTPRELLVSHWWADDWTVEVGTDAVTVSGKLVPHRDTAITPLRHAVLRASALLAGPRLIGMLKRRLIFRARRSTSRFSRTVRLDGAVVVVEDRIIGVPAQAEVIRSPRASKRHVASADSFHRDDLAATLERLDGVSVDRATSSDEVRSTVRIE